MLATVDTLNPDGGILVQEPPFVSLTFKLAKLSLRQRGAQCFAQMQPHLSYEINVFTDAQNVGHDPV